MLVMIAIASCTNNETFTHIFKLVSEFLLIDKTRLSRTLLDSSQLGHFICYALLSFFLAGIFSGRHLLFAPMVALAFGILMELAQIFIPTRHASVLDIGVDASGILLGLGFYLIFVRLIKIKAS